jgi:hypothetical protein
MIKVSEQCGLGLIVVSEHLPMVRFEAIFRATLRRERLFVLILFFLVSRLRAVFRATLRREPYSRPGRYLPTPDASTGLLDPRRAGATAWLRSRALRIVFT